MTIQFDLTPQLLDALRQRAKQDGISPESAAAQIVVDELTEDMKRKAAIALLEKWATEDDEQEQKETGEFLIKALDEDRPADRKLFPPEKKGITW